MPQHPRTWQKKYYRWPFCQSWQNICKRSFLAMILVFALIVLSVVAITATIVALFTDGYRRVPTDWRRLP